MKREQRITLIATFVTVALILLLGFCVSNAEAKYNPAKDYYAKYKAYKERYKDLAKDYRELEGKYEDCKLERTKLRTFIHGKDYNPLGINY